MLRAITSAEIRPAFWNILGQHSGTFSPLDHMGEQLCVVQMSREPSKESGRCPAHIHTHTHTPTYTDTHTHTHTHTHIHAQRSTTRVLYTSRFLSYARTALCAPDDQRTHTGARKISHSHTHTHTHS